MSNTARNSLLQVGNAARDRRMSERWLRNPDDTQDRGHTQRTGNSRSRRPSGIPPQVIQPVRYSRENPARWDRNARPQSYSPSEYSQDSPVQGYDRTSRYSLHSIRSCHGEIVDPDSEHFDAMSNQGGYESPASPPFGKPLDPDEYVDFIPKSFLSLYQVATMGICLDCQKAGKRCHTIIEGTLTCGSCGTNHDVRRRDEVNNDHRHRMLREPPSGTSSSREAPAPARSDAGTMKPPPRLRDRPYANVAPLVIRDRRHGQRWRRESRTTYQDEPTPLTSPVSPIGVTKALPLPQGLSSSPRRTANRRWEPDVSGSQLIDTLRNLNPLGHVRTTLQNRGLAHEVGSFHAIHAAQELRKQGYTDEVTRTGEVKTYNPTYGHVVADDNRSTKRRQ